MMRTWLLLLFLAITYSTTIAYADNETNICNIISDHPGWYQDAENAQTKWGVPVSVQLAIIHQESDFQANAKNPKSTSFGYSQAINKVWQDYETDQGTSASRTNFSAATDFIGWYAQQMKQQNGISPQSAFSLYVAYHDGGEGYRQDLHQGFTPTDRLATRVQDMANQYQVQLVSC